MAGTRMAQFQPPACDEGCIAYGSAGTRSLAWCSLPLEGGLANPGDFGSLLCRQPFYIAEDDGGAQLGRQSRAKARTRAARSFAVLRAQGPGRLGPEAGSSSSSGPIGTLAGRPGPALKARGLASLDGDPVQPGKVAGLAAERGDRPATPLSMTSWATSSASSLSPRRRSRSMKRAVGVCGGQPLEKLRRRRPWAWAIKLASVSTGWLVRWPASGHITRGPWASPGRLRQPARNPGEDRHGRTNACWPAETVDRVDQRARIARTARTAVGAALGVAIESPGGYASSTHPST